MHNWGDESVDWDGIYGAARFIAARLRRYRVNVRDYKEKYGTVRVYCSLGWSQLHSITHPGHVWCRYPKWLWILDCRYGSRIIPFLCNWAVIPFHCWLYRDTYRRAVEKWPHLRDEIVTAADFHELLEGL